MDFDRLFRVADRARGRGKLSGTDVAFIRDEVPKALADFPHFKRPPVIDHPGGFRVTGAPTGTFTRCALLLAGQKALGRRAGGHRFYDRVERDLAMMIMGANFEGNAPKGTFCCSQCTLAILPVLEAGAIRYFNCKPLAHNVRTLIKEKRWRFAGKQNPKLLKWSLVGPSAPA
jgi:hypothetical protein